jgi:two-component system chemotaxis sensor kinase CheA
VARFRKDSINTVGNRDTVEVKGRTVLLVKLGEILEIPKPATRTGASELIPALILRAGENVVAFSVDSIVQEQEILVKGLGRQLSRVRNVSGATVLGSGRLVPILAVSDLVKSAIKGIRPGAGLAARIEELEDETKTVLVVEDSITSRMLLKNILETSGYQVKTAVDGVDAWNALKSEDFDLVVSDIEMPQMDGFELTATIRADEKLSQMPVVLVTSRGSREDRERGIDVGANAYIVKGSFDQNNLLETIQRLV